VAEATRGHKFFSVAMAAAAAYDKRFMELDFSLRNKFLQQLGKQVDFCDRLYVLLNQEEY
jgi:hypothetical protein